MRKPRCAAALCLALCLLLGACGAKADARPLRVPERPAVSLPPLAEKTDPPGCTPLPVYLDGLLCARGYEKRGCRYVPLAPLCDRAGLALRWYGGEDFFTLTLGSLRVEGEAGREYFTASGRFLYAPEGWLIRGEELLLPEHIAAALFGVAPQWDGEALRIGCAGLRLMEGGEDYYALNFPEEELYWLSHIINAEAKEEPLAGQIAVGNVVMNRVQSPDFPNTVFEVIYDTEHTIQFEPVALGGIREEPTEQAQIAAYLVLEGANVVGDCLYFVNPEYGSYWFDSALELRAVIGRHNFYADKD